MRSKTIIAAILPSLFCILHSIPAFAQPTTQPSATEPALIFSGMEAFITQPGRIILRDAWMIGEIDTRGGAEATGPGGFVRVEAIMAWDEQTPDQKLKGIIVTLDDTRSAAFLLFDVDQVPVLASAVSRTSAAAQRLRPPPETDGRRRATFIANGLEIGINAGGNTGGYLAQAGPAGLGVRLETAHFQQFRELLLKAQAALVRDAPR